MADKEEIKTLEELEEKGRILREYKEKFRQMCQENKMIKGSTVLKLYDKIEEIQTSVFSWCFIPRLQCWKC